MPKVNDNWLESLRVIWRDNNIIGLQNTLGAVDRIGIDDYADSK
jgi:hypothetical protein